MAIVTLDEVKLILNIATTDKDARITALIPQVESIVSETCNRTDYPVGMKPLAAMMVNVLLGSTFVSNGTGSENFGTYSYSKAPLSRGWPDHIASELENWKIHSIKSAQPLTQWRDKRGTTPLGTSNPVYGEPGLPIEKSDA